MIINTAIDFWGVLRTYRQTDDPEARHRARVSLMRLALGTSPAARSAAAALAKEGIHVFPSAQHLSAQSTL